MGNRIFELPHGRGSLVFQRQVLDHMYVHAQRFFLDREAGGQLFSTTPHLSVVEIQLATGPYASDRRGRSSFEPDPKRAYQDRLIQFDSGRHAVGLWHTHPEANPSPSSMDAETTHEYLRACGGELHSFVLVILGNKGNPLNMAVWLAGASALRSWTKLPEVELSLLQHVDDA
ncbi:Mov34/MPN/PAD-1 family protein [Ralstonia wenshanensis]|uniref:Mov34/MPN/PAD-1 family protein n=1 Tax=Ralstonia wenshanensis TaxID=2842456 RepID=UPI0037097CF6